MTSQNSPSTLDNPAYASVDGTTENGSARVYPYYHKELDRTFELPCPVGTLRDLDEYAAEVDVRYLERSRNPTTGRVSESLHTERVRCYLGRPDSPAVKAYADYFEDADFSFTHLAVILSEHAGVPYGTLLPVQFNGTELPSVYRDSWDVNSLRLHPAIDAYRQWHADKRKAEQLAEAAEFARDPESSVG